MNLRDERLESRMRPDRNVASSVEAPSTEALVARLRQGDRGAYRSLMQIYERRLFKVAFGFLRDHDDAMDVTQETFVRVFRNLDRMQTDAAFRSWIFRICRNLCIDRLRSSGRNPASAYDDGLDHRPGPGSSAGVISTAATSGSPARQSLRKELGRQLGVALDTLGQSHREILVLREVEGMSYKEIAETLDIPQGTVMSRLYHARRKMQERLRPYLEQTSPGADHAAR